MKHPIGLLLPFALAFDLTAQMPATGSVTSAGIDRFWAVAATLAAGREPNVAEWDSLFAAPGYAELEARERRRAALTRAFRAAFHPAARPARDSLLAAGGWTARVIRHVEGLPARRVAIDAFVTRFRTSGGVLAAAVERIRPVLPAGTIERHGLPPVAMIAFLPDGRGYPGLVVADAAYNASRPEAALTAFFAHESFHFYHWAIGSPSGNRAIDRRDSTFAVLEPLLLKIEEEGIADLADKLPWLGRDSVALVDWTGEPDVSYQLAYQLAVSQFPTLVRSFDAVVVRALTGALTPRAARAGLDSLSLSRAGPLASEWAERSAPR